MMENYLSQPDLPPIRGESMDDPTMETVEEMNSEDLTEDIQRHITLANKAIDVLMDYLGAETPTDQQWAKAQVALQILGL